MENRFGLKDFVLYVLIVVTMVLVWLAMVQRDREWKRLQTLEDLVSNQTRDLTAIRRQLNEGIIQRPSGNSNSTTQPAAGDPFARLKAAEQMPGFARGDWVVDNFGTKVGTLTPLISSDLYATIVQSRVLESLTYRDPYTLDEVPLLARSWQIKDNTEAWQAAYDALKQRIQKEPAAVIKDLPADLKKEFEEALDKVQKKQLSEFPHDLLIMHPGLPSAADITFQIRSGVTFSDGAPMTADDVVFTFDWTMNPAVNAPRDRAYLQKIRSVEKTGDLEVVFRYREPYFEAFSLAGSIGIMPKHFYSQFTPQKFNEDPGLLMGTGPYRLKDPTSWRPGDQIYVVRNERYWGEPNTFDRLLWHQVEKDAASLTMFKNGELDIFAATPEQYKLLKQDKELLKRTQSLEYQSPLAGYSYIAWNQSRGGKPTRYADKRVRQALTMMTNRQRIIDELYLGYGSVASGPFGPSSKQLDPSVKPWPFDPQQARQLMKAAGFEDRNGDGVLESASGVPFEVKLSYPSGNELTERVVLFLKDTFAVGGVKLIPDPQDWPIMVKKLNERDFDAITLAWSSSVESDIYQMFHSDQIKDQGDNFMGYANPDLDRVISQARTTLDEKKRLPLWQQAHRIIHEDQPYTFINSRMALVFIDGRIQNVEKSKLGMNYVQRQVMPMPWFVPRAQQKWSK